MSHIRLKTIYEIEGAYGSTETKTLYAHHNNICDIVCFYEEDGTCLFCVEDTKDNNLYDAIVRLYSPYKNNNGELDDSVSYVKYDEWNNTIK